MIDLDTLFTVLTPFGREELVRRVLAAQAALPPTASHEDIGEQLLVAADDEPDIDAMLDLMAAGEPMNRAG